MNCESWRMEISAWLDDELEDAAARELHVHLADCADCRGFLKDARHMSGILRKGGGVEYGSQVPLLRRRLTIPFASVALGVLVACLFTFIAALALGRVDVDVYFPKEDQNALGETGHMPSTGEYQP